jgi:hypothetical protein
MQLVEQDATLSRDLGVTSGKEGCFDTKDIIQVEAGCTLTQFHPMREDQDTMSSSARGAAEKATFEEKMAERAKKA